ncbi:glycoside hydrolase family 73 protein [Pedobacter sp. 22226]|uniref:glycoside hydrolase family 73 protein n=1 Tax=Pedobacter sp. 22226 TaxID=3453894 RepID=UPI003F86E2F0
MDITRKKYIESIKDAVITATSGTTLFPSVMLAQAALEGGNGASVLAKKYNNHFGIKASGSWKGLTVVMPTTEYVKGVAIKVQATFRAYASLLDSFLDRVNFLKVNSRYAKNGVFSAKTPEDQAKALQKAGYATDPNYANLIINIIKTYNLKQYDTAEAKTEAVSSVKKKA